MVWHDVAQRKAARLDCFFVVQNDDLSKATPLTPFRGWQLKFNT